MPGDIKFLITIYIFVMHFYVILHPFCTAGRLTEAYDELGARYVIPKYCISKPTNMAVPGEQSDDEDNEPDSSAQLLGGHTPTTSTTGSVRQRKSPQQGKHSSSIKVRLSSVGKDIKIPLSGTERVRDIKRKLESEHGVDSKRVTMLYSGRVLGNGLLVRDLAIPKGYIVQAVVSWGFVHTSSHVVYCVIVLS